MERVRSGGREVSCSVSKESRKHGAWVSRQKEALWQVQVTCARLVRSEQSEGRSLMAKMKQKEEKKKSSVNF